MVCLETWMFEMMVLLSGALPNPELQTSVLSICLTTYGMFWMIPFGISAAGSTRISNELGAGRQKVAYLAVKMAKVSFRLGDGVGMLALVQNFKCQRNVEDTWMWASKSTKEFEVKEA
ncbi:unnamed protein product [Lupinus luteus]|uniref:Uncharacterized protein n=1 Tax=Lupinus luteus TaxID=3873 RepID=A0AAV1WWB5_LUPLU